MIGVCGLVFLIIHLIPGDPVDIMLGESAGRVDRERLRRELRLDQPLGKQIVVYFSSLARGDLGTSLHTKKPVASEILARFPATLKLAFSAMLISLSIAIPTGVFSAARQYSVVDQASLFFSLLAVSMPNFWLGPLLVLFFSIHLGWLPVSGSGSLAHLALPAVTLGASLAAILARMTRASMLEALQEDYMRTARAKGLAKWKVLLKHGLGNALLPVVTISGLQFGALLTGSIITETIFSWPGIGRLTVQAINTRDYPMVQGCVLFISLCYVFVNLITDIVYSLLDPRIRRGD
ncbi:MAG: ABC transporter permease [Nitrospinae bacterium]|nr:ABC transporter permease [Nitrospinota bacterium]